MLAQHTHHAPAATTKNIYTSQSPGLSKALKVELQIVAVASGICIIGLGYRIRSIVQAINFKLAHEKIQVQERTAQELSNTQIRLIAAQDQRSQTITHTNEKRTKEIADQDIETAVTLAELEQNIAQSHKLLSVKLAQLESEAAAAYSLYESQMQSIHQHIQLTNPNTNDRP